VVPFYLKNPHFPHDKLYRRAVLSRPVLSSSLANRLAKSRPPPLKSLRGLGWIHEIKHDGFRILARRDSAGVRLITRAGNDFSSRFPFIGMAVSKLPVSSRLIDGEAIVCDENGLAVFELIRRHGALASAVHCAFDLLELDGRDLRREPIEKRKALLAMFLKGQQTSIVLNEVYEEDGAIVFREACKLGCEGIVSKRLGLNVSPGPVAALGEGREPESASGKARGRGGLGTIAGTKKILSRCPH
jgi:bifunctional non-homologous end joining protein LigD